MTRNTTPKADEQEQFELINNDDATTNKLLGSNEATDPIKEKIIAAYRALGLNKSMRATTPTTAKGDSQIQKDTSFAKSIRGYLQKETGKETEYGKKVKTNADDATTPVGKVDIVKTKKQPRGKKDKSATSDQKTE